MEFELLSDLNEEFDSLNLWISDDYYTEEIKRSSSNMKVDPNIKTKKTGILSKAVSVIVRMIDKIIASIGEFLSKLFMTKTERSNYELFKKLSNENKEFSQEKIKVKDYRNYIKMLDEQIDAVEDACNGIKAGKDGPIDQLMNKCKMVLGTGAKAGKATIGVFTVEAALRMAEADIGMARKLNRILKTDRNAMKILENSIGAKEATKFEKDIEKLSKEIGLRRMLANLKGRKFDTINDAVNSIVNDIGDVTKSKRLYANLIKNKDVRKAAGGVAKKAGKEIAETGVEKAKRVVQSSVEKAAKAITGNQNIKVTSTETGREAQVKGIIQNVTDFTNKVTKKYKRRESVTVSDLSSRLNQLNADMQFCSNALNKAKSPKEKADLRGVMSTISGEIARMQTTINQIRSSNNGSGEYFKRTRAEDMGEKARSVYGKYS